MTLGINTDSLAHLSFDELLPFVSGLGITHVEFGCGNWSKAPHINVDALLESERARREFLSKIKDHGLKISALNCSGNQLHPGDSGKKHDALVRKTFRLARHFKLTRVVMMSGLPGGGPSDRHANWITTAWPPETQEILRWQWDAVGIPYWKNLVRFGKENGITKIALENHGAQLVYNARTLLQLRDAVGATVGANYDPSHVMWMGGSPIAVIRELGKAIFHVHAKDTLIDAHNAGLQTLIETRDISDVASRSWNYVTVGRGHDELWWSTFIAELRIAGYDGVLSIEHEDLLMDNEEAVKRSCDFLHRIVMRKKPPASL